MKILVFIFMIAAKGIRLRIQAVENITYDMYDIRYIFTYYINKVIYISENYNISVIFDKLYLGDDSNNLTDAYFINIQKIVRDSLNTIYSNCIPQNMQELFLSPIEVYFRKNKLKLLEKCKDSYNNDSLKYLIDATKKGFIDSEINRYIDRLLKEDVITNNSLVMFIENIYAANFGYYINISIKCQNNNKKLLYISHNSIINIEDIYQSDYKIGKIKNSAASNIRKITIYNNEKVCEFGFNNNILDILFLNLIKPIVKIYMSTKKDKSTFGYIQLLLQKYLDDLYKDDIASSCMVYESDIRLILHNYNGCFNKIKYISMVDDKQAEILIKSVFTTLFFNCEHLLDIFFQELMLNINIYYENLISTCKQYNTKQSAMIISIYKIIK